MSISSRTTLKHGIPNGASSLDKEDKTMPDKPQKCSKKGTIDEQAQKALDEIGRVERIDKKLEMQLEAVKTHLRNIMADHHH